MKPCPGSGKEPVERLGGVILGIRHVRCAECRRVVEATQGPHITPTHFVTPPEVA